MNADTFHRRAETFGFDSGNPWSLPALRLLFNVPRAYTPLVDSWEALFPGTAPALRKLTNDGWVAYQDQIVVDLRTGLPSSKPSRPVARYILTAAGNRLLGEAERDLRVLRARWQPLASHNEPSVRELLASFNLDGSHARFGLSAGHASEIAGMSDRTGRWWVQKLVSEKLVRELPEKWPDVRVVVPAHWRVQRDVCRQLTSVLSAFNDWAVLKSQWPLSQTRFLNDIDPARIGISGATDFDHDIEAQRLLALLLSSQRVNASHLEVEPKFTMLADTTVSPAVIGSSPGLVFYQPDAVLRAADDSGRMRRVVVEYERHQSRRDAWAHIERFCAWVATTLLPFESATLCFVVDTSARERGYIELVEAFADWTIDHPQVSPPNALTLAVSSMLSVDAASDPLTDSAWHRVELQPGTAERLVLHDPHGNTPYNTYFSKKRAR